MVFQMSCLTPYGSLFVIVLTVFSNPGMSLNEV